MRRRSGHETLSCKSGQRFLLFGVSILGLGAIAAAQQSRIRSLQQPIGDPTTVSTAAGDTQRSKVPHHSRAIRSNRGIRNSRATRSSRDRSTGPQQQAQSDPGAARVSYIHGDVSTQHSDSSEWVAATVNTPVVNGDHVSTGKNARAEIQLDYANILRLSDESTANVVNLSRDANSTSDRPGPGEF